MKRITKHIFMKSTIQLGIALISLIFLTACGDNQKTYDASGSFEAIERIISSEATGKIISLNIEEGKMIAAGDTIGRIDVSKLELQSQQVTASISALSEKSGSGISVLSSQLNAQESQRALLEQQLFNLNKEIARFHNLVKSNAAPQKQLDDLTGQRAVLQKQLSANQTQVGVIKAQINAQVDPSEKQLALIQKQMNDGIVISEFSGTITTQMAYNGEFTVLGKPLYKIADLQEIILRAYITGNQVPNVKLNQEVTVLTDDGSGGFNEEKGTVTWISSKAEFTPKTIQTKDERANLVYAIKVKVPNDGKYKIGMYGQIKF
ncbi:MAG: HlyD family secretion protein [Bacteroidia bacterium]|jgi:HlyD family secretion protein